MQFIAVLSLAAVALALPADNVLVRSANTCGNGATISCCNGKSISGFSIASGQCYSGEQCSDNSVYCCSTTQRGFVNFAESCSGTTGDDGGASTADASDALALAGDILGALGGGA